MARSFDDATRRNIAELCAAFTRAPTGEAAPALKRAAVAIALTASETGPGAAFLLTQRAATLRSHAAQWALPGGRCDPGETPAQSALRELHEEVGLELGEGDVLGLLDDYPTRSGYLITPVVVWASTKAALVPNPAEVASVHRIALDKIERRRRVQLHHDPRKHAARDPFSSRRSAHPRADGGADLSIPRSAGRPQHPRGRTGTAGVCLEIGLNRHCERSEAIHRAAKKNGLLRFARNDDEGCPERGLRRRLFRRPYGQQEQSKGGAECASGTL